MNAEPLVFIRATRVYSVPPVCSAQWTPADWERSSRLVYEPLTLTILGMTWRATGERDARGQLLYEVSR